jgi:hypothetical protein
VLHGLDQGCLLLALKQGLKANDVLPLKQG